MTGRLRFDLGGEAVMATLDGDRWMVQCADPDVGELASLRLNHDFPPSRFQSPSFGFADRAALVAAQKAFRGQIADLAPLPVTDKEVVY